MSNIINSFKKFFSKKENTNKVNLDEIRSILKDSLYGVKDCGFDVKMINYSFEPITLQNLSLEIIIRPNTSNYDIDEFFSELDNSISHIEHSDMNVKMNFTINMDIFSKAKLHIIHAYLVDIYPNIFNLPAIDTVQGRQKIISDLSKVDNFKEFVNHPDTVGHLDELKSAIVVKLDITGEHEGNNI
jgi:hypothetical protein